MFTFPVCHFATLDTTIIENSIDLNGTDEYLSQSALGAGDDASKNIVSTWFKLDTTASDQTILSAGSSGSDYAQIIYRSSQNTNIIHEAVGGPVLWSVEFAVTLSADTWYHLLASFDSDEATSTDRIRMWLDGSALSTNGSPSWPGSTQDGYFGTNRSHYWGRFTTSSSFMNGHLAQSLMIDGNSEQAGDQSASDFYSSGIVDVTGVTRGTNGSLLMYENSADLGEDEGSGTNDWTENNIDSSNQSTDVPS